jgi:hypothetical protein
MWITGIFMLLGLGTAALRPRALAEVSRQPTAAQLALQPNCQTVAADPQPPLNIRSQPHAASSHTIVGTVNNGAVLTVVATQSAWLKIAQPISGWVYQPLTSTHCTRTVDPSAGIVDSIGAVRKHPTLQVLDSAYDRFAAGQLQNALSLLQSVSPTDMAYPQAQVAYQAMSEQWHQGSLAYQAARAASRTGQWSTVLLQVQKVPDVRYWREKMTPLVKQAIVNQSHDTPVP